MTTSTAITETDAQKKKHLMVMNFKYLSHTLFLVLSLLAAERGGVGLSPCAPVIVFCCLGLWPSD